MPPSLPDYNPPLQRCAALAAGLAPLLVLLAFTGIVLGWLPADLGLAAMLACTVWVLFEMNRFQRAVDAYNAEYARRHLQWRRPEHIAELMASPACGEPARGFAQRFLDCNRQLLADGRLP